jgi:hypothetical protein
MEVIYKKENFLFERIHEYQFSIHFNVINNNIQLDKIIDFGLMKLLSDVNPDIYIESKIDTISEHEVEFVFLLKHFFEDLGLPQHYSYMNTTKMVYENAVIFSSKPIYDKKPDWIPENVELCPFHSLICKFEIETLHKINITIDLHMEQKKIIVPLMIQKLFGIILHKMFIRVKQFIENL